MLRQFVLKLNRACNLACPYCYYINSDTRGYGSRMPLSMLRDFLDKYYVYCERHGIQGVIVFHGGEPLLMGKRYFDAILRHKGFEDERFFPIVQTNGVLLDRDWLQLFAAHKVEVGLSLDGPAEIHNANRPKRNGLPSYLDVVRAIQLLQEENIPFGVLAVVTPAASGRAVFEHLLGLGIKSMDFLLPIGSHAADPLSATERTAVARFLQEAFLSWYILDDPTVNVRLFATIVKMVYRKHQGYFATGTKTWEDFAVCETDGTVAMLEELSELDRFCGTSFYNTGLNYRHHPFERIADTISDFWEKHKADELPSKCKSCKANNGCRGGNFGTRYDGRTFDNPSINCDSLYGLVDIASRLKEGLEPLEPALVH